MLSNSNTVKRKHFLHFASLDLKDTAETKVNKLTTEDEIDDYSLNMLNAIVFTWVDIFLYNKISNKLFLFSFHMICYVGR